MQNIKQNSIQISKHQISILSLLILVFFFSLFAVLTGEKTISSTAWILDLAFDMIGMLIAIILYFSCCMDIMAHEKENFYFRFMILINFFSFITDFYGTILNGDASLHHLLYILDLLGYLSNICRSYICFLFVICVLKIREEEVKELKVIVFICILVQVSLFVVNLFKPIIFSISKEGYFVASTTEWLCYPYYLILFFLTIFMMVSSKISSIVKLSITLYVTVPMVFDFINLWIFNLSSLIFIASMVSMLLMYGQIYVQRGYELEKEKSELAKTQLNSMLMQVNPHFIYNTLGSISSLCLLDAEVAAEMTNTFAHYLRGNIDAMMEDATVSFEKELEQVKLYLRIEQVRFREIDVYYRIGPKDFQVPSLSIQPLAENAIRHGIRQKLDSRGILEIETFEDDSSYIIKVKDNGAGFDPDQMFTHDGRSHLGIDNVRKRLELLFNGSLAIESELGKGTCCTIAIPKNEKERRKNK